MVCMALMAGLAGVALCFSAYAHPSCLADLEGTEAFAIILCSPFPISLLVSRNEVCDALPPAGGHPFAVIAEAFVGNPKSYHPSSQAMRATPACGDTAFKG